MTLYDLLAPVYGIWAALTETKAHGRALELLRRFPCESLLEVAVGTGTESAALSAAPGRRVCAGVDLSANMLKRARTRISRTPGGHVALCQADARALPFRSGAFDCVLCCYMLDLLPEADISIVLGEFERVLRGRGRLILAVMGRQAPVVNRIWMVLFRRLPVLVGGCRPIDTANWLRASGWDVESQEQVTQNGFRSEILVGSPRASISA